MFVCTTVLYEYMKSFRNEVNHLVGNAHVRIIICHEFYHGIIYTANEARRLLAAVHFYRFHNISLHIRPGWSCLFTLP